MRVLWTSAVLFLTICYGVNAGSRTVGASAVVAYAKRIDVAKIDKTLKSQSLETWLLSRELHLDHIRWSRGDCDIRPDEPASKRGLPALRANRLSLSERVGADIGKTRNDSNWYPRPNCFLAL